MVNIASVNRDRLTKTRRSLSLAQRMGEGVQLVASKRSEDGRTGEGRDRLSPERRSWNMSRIRGKDTTPEKIVRSLLHRLGYRFRLHIRIPVPMVGTARRTVRTPRRGIPTRIVRSVSVDILLPKQRLAVFVHGCFWHRHRGCKNCTMPTHRRAWWLAKLNGNAARDKVHQRALRKLGLRPVVIWECQTEKPKTLARLRRKRSQLIG